MKTHSTKASRDLDAFLERLIANGRAPGISALVACRERVLYRFTGGCAVAVPEPQPLSKDAVFDCASLTKPLVTALLACRLIDSGVLSAESNVVEWLTELRGTDKDGITVWQLLTHASGLPAWKPVYLLATGIEGTLKAVSSIPLESEPGSETRYGCLAYILLGIVLERVAGTGLGELASREIFRPLGLTSTFHHGLPPDTIPRTAATELGTAYEKGMAGELGRGFGRWRDYMIRGEVHDCNAFYLGGHSGNAGLFSTAEELSCIAREVLTGKGGIVSAGARSLLLSGGADFQPTGRFTAGFEKADPVETSAGPALSRDAVGHTGFTGVSLWLEPRGETIYILLTNRIHPRVTGLNMNEVRRGFHHWASRIPQQSTE